MRFRDDTTFKAVENEFSKLVAHYKSREKKWREKLGRWSEKTSAVIHEIIQDKVGSNTKQLLALAKAMKVMEARLQMMKMILHKDCIEKCRLNSE